MRRGSAAAVITTKIPTTRAITTRAKPELLCPVESTEDSPLPAGRVELSIVASGYIDSGFALTRTRSTQFDGVKRACRRGNQEAPSARSFVWIDLECGVCEITECFEYFGKQLRVG